MTVRELFELDGQVVLITGGSRGLGLQMASALGEMGAKIAICARKPQELDVAAAELERLGIETFTAPCDLANRGRAAALGGSRAGSIRPHRRAGQ